MVVFSLLKRSFLHLVSVRAEVSGEKITAFRRWTSPSLPIAYIVYTIYSGFRMLWAEVGCVASDGIFSFVNRILVNALFYFSCTFVNVLSCLSCMY